jgi:hypothetical protein
MIYDYETLNKLDDEKELALSPLRYYVLGLDRADTEC